MLLPLLPLLIEALERKDHFPSDPTLTITAAIYAVTIGLTSKNKASFGLCLIIGLAFSAVFGIVLASNSQIIGVGQASLVAIGTVFIIHALERYNRHVADCTPFLEFT
jgi:hypothetical protein